MERSNASVTRGGATEARPGGGAAHNGKPCETCSGRSGLQVYSANGYRMCRACHRRLCLVCDRRLAAGGRSPKCEGCRREFGMHDAVRLDHRGHGYRGSAPPAADTYRQEWIAEYARRVAAREPLHRPGDDRNAPPPDHERDAPPRSPARVSAGDEGEGPAPPARDSGPPAICDADETGAPAPVEHRRRKSCRSSR